MSGELKSQERFEPVVQGLLTKNNENLRVACLTLINAIVTQTDDLEYRLHLRNEIVRAGLCDILEVSYQFLHFAFLNRSFLNKCLSLIGFGERCNQRIKVTN